ncbi:MAG: CDP-alcohol phosphatidyltransferase family protein [Rhodanobacteraceae bacterium]|nr:CDP-alcohol phosphatidyltransferase family protein [Rhodanobacteraceae bacterium]
MRHIPNLLTLLRMLLTVPLAWLLRDGRFDAALIVALVAGFSDALDGFLAKRFSWQSRLGGLLDPVADKLLLVACFVGLAQVGALPWWLAALVIGRDVLIVSGAVAYHNLVGPLDAAPSALSKLTTVLQIMLVLATLLHLSRFAEWPAWLNLALLAAVMFATLASGIDYVVRWSIKAWRETHSQRSGSQ